MIAESLGFSCGEFVNVNVAGYNAWTIFSGTIADSSAGPAHENNFAVRDDNLDFRSSRLDGLSDVDGRDGRANFFIKSSAADSFKIHQAAHVDNFVYVANSLRKPRRRSSRENLRLQNHNGRHRLRRDDKLAIGAVDFVVEPVDVHDFAIAINRRHGKTFVAAEKNRCARA